jgi:hypothetical protein
LTGKAVSDDLHKKDAIEDRREVEELDAAQPGMPLPGMAFFKAHEPLEYQRVS